MGNGLTSECSDRYSLTKEISSVRDAPLDFKGGGEQEVFVKKKKLDPLKGKKKKNLTHT